MQKMMDDVQLFDVVFCIEDVTALVYDGSDKPSVRDRGVSKFIPVRVDVESAMHLHIFLMYLDRPRPYETTLKKMKVSRIKRLILW